jgi:hypothetical protein
MLEKSRYSDMTCTTVWLNLLPPYVQNSVRLEVKKRKIDVSETYCAEPVGLLPSCFALCQQRLDHYGIRLTPSADTKLRHSYLSSI